MKNKRQHIVPRAYLAGFVDPNTPKGKEPYVWVYERGSAGPFARAPHKTAARSHYYSITAPDGTRDNAVEALLARVEGEAIPILRTLAAGRNPLDLTADERDMAAFLIALFEVRVPRFRNLVEETSADIVKRASRMLASDKAGFEALMAKGYEAEGKPLPNDLERVREFILGGEFKVTTDPALSLKTMLELAPRIASFAAAFQWRVLEAPRGHAFVTSDAPLVRISTAPNLPRWQGVGWVTPYMETTLPLSPERCLLISQHHPTGVEAVSSHQVREVNWRTAALADRQVFSSRPIAAERLNAPKQRTLLWEPASRVTVAPAEDEPTPPEPASPNGDDDSA